jgi:hypothetical protein
MRTTSLIAVVLVTVSTCAGAILLATRSTAAPAPPLPPGVKAWEYKLLSDFQLVQAGVPPGGKARQPANDGLNDGLNNLGAEGWELVTVIENPNGGAAKYYFKRPK